MKKTLRIILRDYFPNLRFLSNFGTYLLSEGIGKAIPFFLLPILTSYLTTEEFGKLVNFSVFLNICIPIIGLNGFTFLNVQYNKISKKDLALSINNILYQSTIIFIFLFIAVHFFGNYFEQVLFISTGWQFLALFTAFFASCYALYSSLLRVESNAIPFALTQFTHSVVLFCVTIYFVVKTTFGWESRAYGSFASFLCVGIYSLWAIKKRFGLFLPLSKKIISSSVFFGLPLLPHSLSFWLKSSADKIIITQKLGLSENGVYSIAVMLGSIITIILTAFFNVYSPWMLKKLSECEIEGFKKANAIKLLLVKNTYLFLTGLGVMCLLGYLLAKILFPLFFSGEYILALPLLPYVFVISFLNGIYSILSVYLLYMEKTKIFGTITFVSSLLQVGISYPLIYNFGVTGALYSAIIAGIIMSIALFYWSQRLYPMPWFRTFYLNNNRF